MRKTGNVHQKKETFIVALGASAGGLKALEEFFENTPPDSNLSFVVIQHLDPHHESLLSDILQKSGSLEVTEVKEKVEIAPNHVYVISPGYDLDLKDNFLIPVRQKNIKGIRMPIDYFLRQLKDNRQDRSIAVILSGTGSDGTLGLKEIKSENGLILVQDPSTAKNSGMPESAIATGLADLILPPAEMPERIIAYIRNFVSGKQIKKELTYDKQENQINSIFKIISKNTRHDFSSYKRSTLLRRIQRRMVVNNISSLSGYIRLLKDNEEESSLLFKDMLIGVTSFFRDTKAFSTLGEKFFPENFQNSDQRDIRIWVTGCATGEEAYSLAILAHHYREKFRSNKKIRIFATDIDESALEIARKGIYPLNVSYDIPEEFLNRYFFREDNFFRVKKEIRDLVIFAEHSLVKDPPYSGMDLISCRNLLIYLENDIQKKILHLFHYSLKDEGYLFLGLSETTGKSKTLFKTIDNKLKIFRKDPHVKVNRKYDLAAFTLEDKSHKYSSGKKLSIKEFAEKEAFTKFMDPFLIISSNGDIQYSMGNIKDYFEFRPGEPTFNILNIVSGSLKVPLANALRSLKVKKQNIHFDKVKIPLSDDKYKMIKLSVLPVRKPSDFDDLYEVIIKPVEYTDQKVSLKKSKLYADKEKEEYYFKLEKELQETREYLQNVIEELETANEELKSANEEAQSSNEELQSSNEELETSKEELQSLNEELETANTELQRRIKDVTKINNDFYNLITSTKIGVIFLDKQMRIQKFTPAVTEYIPLKESDIDRPLADFSALLGYEDLEETAQNVLQTLIPVEEEIQNRKNQFLWTRFLPYRTTEDSIEGVVITLADITQNKTMQEKMAAERAKFEMLFRNLNSGVVQLVFLYDKKGNAIDAVFADANEAFSHHTGIERNEVINKKLKDVFPSQHNEFFNKLAALIKNGGTLEESLFSKSLKRNLRLSAYSVDNDSVMMLIDDISERIKAAEELKKSEQKFRNLFSNMNLGISINKLSYDTGTKKPDAIILNANDGFKKIFEKTKTGIVNRRLSDMLKILKSDHLEQIIEKVQKNSKFNTEIHLENKDRFYKAYAIPLDSELFAFVLEDITSEKKEYLTSHHLASLVESTDNAIYSISPRGKIISWNKGAERFYGYTSEEIIGKDVAVLSNGLSSDEHKKLIHSILKNKSSLTAEIIQVRKDGGKMPVSLTKSPVYDGQNEIIAISDVVKDMSKIKQREEDLLTAKKKTEEAGKLKTAFLQNVSHEIRTPMNSILGFTEVLKNKMNSPEYQDYMGAIQESGRQLIRLIDDIMDISRIEAGELTLEKSWFNPNELLISLEKQFKAILKTEQKDRIDLRLKIPGEKKSFRIFSDNYRLRQILTNLLSNATKYTEKGFIEFGYQIKEEMMEFYVKDSGRGISKKHLDLIFDRFKRVESKADTNIKGTGIGLSIAKNLTELLGGKITCESEEGAGSLFVFTIPYESDVQAGIEVPKQNEPLPAKIPDFQGRKILVTEDDSFSMLMLEALLSDTGAEILQAKDGLQAIKLFDEHEVDLVLLDIRLPEMDGFEVLKNIKKMDGHTPVIAQTAFAMPEERNRSLKAGFNDYLTKPLTSDMLYRTLRKFLEG